MAVAEKPKFTHAVVPFYRDIRVIQVFIQVIFAIFFIGGIILAISNLTSNLRQDNQRVDFKVFGSTFGPAISEGVSASQPWGWINDVDQLERIVWITLGLVALASAGGLYWLNTRNKKRLMAIPAVILLVLVGSLVGYPPSAIAADLAETLPDYLYPNSITRAIITGISNTLRVVVLSIIASTVVGVFVGVGLLSRNFLTRNVAMIYTEIFRNTPLLIQLFFIYGTLTQIILPVPRQSNYPFKDLWGINLPLPDEGLIFNKRGVYFVKAHGTDSLLLAIGGLVIGLVAAWWVNRWRLRIQESTGQPARAWWYALPAFAVPTLIGLWLWGPITYEYPALQGANVQGGTELSIAFFCLFLGLTFYTSAFIADIVRAGIQAVPYGQIEAARSQGLKGSQVMGMVVLPQALRLIVPPLGNQYVNIGKNSSLGVAVGFIETFRVVQLANNEKGQAIPLFVGLMIIYLAFSLILSALAGLMNTMTRIQTR